MKRRDTFGGMAEKGQGCGLGLGLYISCVANTKYHHQSFDQPTHIAQDARHTLSHSHILISQTRLDIQVTSGQVRSGQVSVPLQTLQP